MPSKGRLLAKVLVDNAGDIAAGSLDNASIADGSITTAKIADSAITANKLDSTSIQDKLGYEPANTGKAIAMSIVFGG